MFIVKLMGGLGNQMFQYAFGKSLEVVSGHPVLFDKTFFDEVAKTEIGNTGRNANGVSIRSFELYIFKNLTIQYATPKEIEKCKKRNIPRMIRKIFNLSNSNRIKEKDPFIYDQNLLCKRKNAYYEGYFQNELYFKNIKDELKEYFKLPELRENDAYNKNLLNKINATKNSVFIHVRREDYVQLNWLVTQNYYKNAVKYMQEHIENPKFFVFCAEDPEYIKNNFDIGTEFELIGEQNKTRETFFENMRLMMACNHAIIANSSYSWWSAWLSDDTGKIVIAPSPWINGEDYIICPNWIKIGNK